MEQVIEDSLRQGVATRTSRITFGWVAVEIAPPTYLVRLAEVSEGEPEGATLYPIRPQFDYTVASLRYAADTTTTEVGDACFNLDAARHWNYTGYAHAGTVTRLRGH